jgi:predicted nucleic acid-binding Zn ribbon protein
MAFGKLNDILRVLSQKYPALSKRLGEAQALGRWEKAVGPVIGKHARAIRVEKGVLWVEVDHPAWKSELHHRKRQILDILNRADGAGSEAPLEDILLLDPRRARTYET